jgi:hypothetical protein
MILLNIFFLFGVLLSTPIHAYAESSDGIYPIHSIDPNAPTTELRPLDALAESSVSVKFPTER